MCPKRHSSQFTRLLPHRANPRPTNQPSDQAGEGPRHKRNHGAQADRPHNVLMEVDPVSDCLGAADPAAATLSAVRCFLWRS
jgi:hypothetical protein